MSILNILRYPDPRLHKKAKPVTVFDERLKKLIADMAETMYKAPGIGLAANQVGELLRLVVLDVDFAYADAKDRRRNPIYLLNPVICQCEGETVFEEACLSVPDLGVEIARPACVQVRAVDLDGNDVVIEADGLLARALQHEIDHLNGTTILEHASPLRRTMYKKRLKKKAGRDA